MSAGQSSQEYEHAEKPKDPSHAKPYCVNYDRLVSMTRRHMCNPHIDFASPIAVGPTRPIRMLPTDWGSHRFSDCLYAISMGAFSSSPHSDRRAEATEAQHTLLSGSRASSDNNFVTTRDDDDSLARIKVDLKDGAPDNPVVIFASEACILSAELLRVMGTNTAVETANGKSHVHCLPA